MGTASTQPRPLLHLSEISERTRVPIETLRWLRKQGRGPKTFRLGRRVVAYSDHVDQWIAEQAAAQGVA